MKTLSVTLKFVEGPEDVVIAMDTFAYNITTNTRHLELDGESYGLGYDYEGFWYLLPSDDPLVFLLTSHPPDEDGGYRQFDEADEGFEQW